MIYVLVWWLIIQVLGWLALPTAMRLFRWLPDRGYAFSKALGLLLSSYFLWVGASTGLLRNDSGGILFALLLVAGISAWCFFRQLNGELQDFLRNKKGLVITIEILFALALLGWAALRAYAPFKIESAGGEKFMEIAFLNAILRSEHFPPLDPWLSGFAISYYYFGYVMMALVTRLSGAPAGIGFDLYDSLLFALTMVGAFGVVYNLVKLGQRQSRVLREDAGQRMDSGLADEASQRAPVTTEVVAGAGPISSANPLSDAVAIRLPAVTHRPPLTPDERPPLAAGILGAVFVAFLGNLEGLWEALHSWGKLPASFWSWLNIPGLAAAQTNGSWYPGEWMWWWRGSRVIQDVDLLGAPINVSPIDEFPFFSFMLGDNHPHVLALPFVLLAIGMALNLLVRQLSMKQDFHRRAAENAEKSDEEKLGEPGVSAVKNDHPSKKPWWNPVAYALDGDWGLFVGAAVVIGALGFLNTWDLPIYLGLATLAYGVGEAARLGRLDRQVVQRAGLLGLALGVASFVLYFFFYISFSSQAGGVLPHVLPPTRLPQYLTMFGTFIFVLACFLPVFLVKLNAGGHPPRTADGA